MSPRAPRPAKLRPPAPDAVDTPLRLFLAVPLPAEVQALIAEQIAGLREEGWPVRWVHPEMAHLTLHFLGETEPERAELVRLGAPAVVARHRAFDLRTAGFGVFPSFRRPRVLWLGLHGTTYKLEALQRDLGELLRELGFTVGDEPYRPHITLGRMRNDEDERFKLRELREAVKARFIDAASGAAVAPPARAIPVRDVLLMRSHLGPGGARHEPLASFPLGDQQ
jgi:2'-5' RNA ligase